MKKIIFILYLFSVTSAFYLPKTFESDLKSVEKRQSSASLGVRRCGVNDSEVFRIGDGIPWPQNVVTYCIVQSSTVLPANVVRRKIRQAFDSWSTYIPRQFQEIQDPAQANIKISFAKRDHGDFDPFDGPGGIYGHAYPNGTFHFDDDELWHDFSPNDSIDPEDTDMLWVATHEMGHVLGLAHNLKIMTSIMKPFYMTPKDDRGFYRKPRLIELDIANVRGIYGAKQGNSGRRKK